MTTQHHPEMPADYVDAVLGSIGHGSAAGPDDAAVAAARASLSQLTDNALFMGWAARFLAGGGIP